MSGLHIKSIMPADLHVGQVKHSKHIMLIPLQSDPSQIRHALIQTATSFCTSFPQKSSISWVSLIPPIRLPAMVSLQHTFQRQE